MLNDTGYLFLGKAEMLLMHANLFTPIELENRIFTKVLLTNKRDRLLAMANSTDDKPSNRFTQYLKLR